MTKERKSEELTQQTYICICVYTYIERNSEYKMEEKAKLPGNRLKAFWGGHRATFLINNGPQPYVKIIVITSCSINSSRSCKYIYVIYIEGNEKDKTGKEGMKKEVVFNGISFTSPICLF